MTKIKLNNDYYLLRHGEAFSNIEPAWLSSWPEIKISHLTPNGKKQIEKLSFYFQKNNIDIIYSSDLNRTKQTAQIIAKKIKKPIIFSAQLRELDFGIFNGCHPDTYHVYFKNFLERFTKKIPQGENLNQCSKRMFDFFKKINKEQNNKKIIIISHGDPLWLLEAKIKNLTKIQTIKAHKFHLLPGEFRYLNNSKN